MPDKGFESEVREFGVAAVAGRGRCRGNPGIHAGFGNRAPVNGKHIPASKPERTPAHRPQVQDLCGRLVDVAQALAVGEDPTGLECGACYRVREAPKNTPPNIWERGQPPSLPAPATVERCGKCDGGRAYLRLDMEAAPAMLSCRRCGWSVFVNCHSVSERRIAPSGPLEEELKLGKRFRR